MNKQIRPKSLRFMVTGMLFTIDVIPVSMKFTED